MQAQRLNNKRKVWNTRLWTYRIMPTTEDPQVDKKSAKTGTSKPYQIFYAATGYTRLSYRVARVPYATIL